MKSKRQLIIMEIIKNHDISTQEELVDRLLENGIEVTQATISRDIKKLGLVKVPDGFGGYKYSLPVEWKQTDVNNWLKRMFRDFVIGIDYSENIIVVNTLPGTADGVGSAIDNLEWEEIIGTVAGDDTVIIVVKPKEETETICQNLEKFWS